MLYSTAIITLSATLCGYAAAADTTRPTNPPLEVVSDIFLKQDDTEAANEAHYYSIIEAATGLGNYPGRFRGQAHLSASFVHALQKKMGIAFSPFGGGDGGFQRGRIVSTTTMTASSPQHVDHYPAGTDGKMRSVDQDRVAFVVLNTNPDAYFVHGDVSVPIVEGSLVHFIGGIPHNTIVNSGSVKLLGPFDAKHFTSVGGNLFVSCQSQQKCLAIDPTQPTLDLQFTCVDCPGGLEDCALARAKFDQCKKNECISLFQAI